MAPQVATDEQDEFEQAASAQDRMSGYEATRDADVEDQREYRMVPARTPCTLGIVGFELATQRDTSKKFNPAIFAKISVEAPEEYADGSSNFNVRLSLNPVVGEGKQSSGWDMTVSQLSWLYAAVNQVSAQEGKAAMINEVLAEFPNLDADDEPALHAALVENANEQLKGKTFKTKGIGIKAGGPTGRKLPDGTDDRYRDQQTFGTLDYPKAARK